MAVAYVVNGADEKSGWLCGARATYEGGKQVVLDTQKYFEGMGWHCGFQYGGGNEVDPEKTQGTIIQMQMVMRDYSGKHKIEITMSRTPLL
jgi:hypothetical protein